MLAQQEQSTRARNACLTCRKWKRKCTKEIPQCFLCRRYGRACDYTSAGSDSTTSQSTLRNPDQSISTENGIWAISGIHDTHWKPNTSLNPCAAPFLDCDIPLDGRYFARKRQANLPPEVLRYLRSSMQIRHEVDIYFSSVHTFLPIGRRSVKRCIFETNFKMNSI